MMMNNGDRKRIFWLLKKYSSYTAWKALGDSFQAFVDEFEYALKHEKHQLESDSLWFDAIKAFWKGCEGFDKGLPLLKRGDRYIFTNKGNWLIYEELKYASRLMNADGYGEEYVHDWMVNKDQAFAAFEKIEPFKECLLITEKKDLTTAATFDTETVFWTNKWPRHLDYAQFNFPSELAEVPDPTTTTIESGQEASITGIWEPEWPGANTKTRSISNIFSLFTPSTPTNVQKGCMNYLIAGTIVPPYQDGDKKPVMPVRWRLIWEDTRYKDGVVPEEEKDYFLVHTQPQINVTTTERLRCEAGLPCPREGYWFTPAKENSRRQFNQGNIMPHFDAQYGATIWQWDDQQ